ncbi:MAG TPA: NAD-dependent epimerase/dehydratase family protein, partial [Byssovorax sp.]
NPDAPDVKALAAKGVEIVRGDLEDTAALAKLADGADALLHLAAHVGDRGPVEVFERVNVGGTRRALEAAKEASVKRFVLCSSTAVYGRPDRGRVTEAWPTRKSGLPYEDTKTDAERLAFARGAELGLEVAAVRPPIIYGPNDRNFMPRVVEALSKGRFVLIDGGSAPLNLVWVDHVVDVLLLCATHPAAAGEAFNVMDEVDGAPPSVREVGETIAREAGLPAPTRTLPFPVAMGLAHVVHKAFSIAKPDASPPLSPFVVKLMTRHVIYDASKAARVLGWSPRRHALESVAAEARAFATRR